MPADIISSAGPSGCLHGVGFLQKVGFLPPFAKPFRSPLADLAFGLLTARNQVAGRDFNDPVAQQGGGETALGTAHVRRFAADEDLQKGGHAVETLREHLDLLHDVLLALADRPGCAIGLGLRRCPNRCAPVWPGRQGRGPSPGSR